MGFFSQLGRDFAAFKVMVNLNKKLTPVAEDNSLTAADMIEQWAAETPGKEALVFQGRSYTYAEYNAEGNKYAHWAKAQGLQNGDVVAILMENRPEFLFAWLGLAKVGVISALINTNLTHNALAHSINIAKAKHVILGAELAGNFQSARGHLDGNPKVWMQGGTVEGAEDLDAALASVPADPVGREARPGLTGQDICFYIYTSGTTGLPKAARFSHSRFQTGTGTFSLAIPATSDDRVYVCLPLYHSAGGVAAIGIALFAGGTIVLSRKFSVSHFWDEVADSNATIFQYIGELCRYLLNADPHPKERTHKLRACLGNGLRPEVWGPFQERFNIPRIVEFYAATEGNVGLLNFEGYPGAVGRFYWFAKSAYEHVKFVKFDVDTEQPVRGPDGFCVECKPGEVGELIGAIADEPGRRFDGYNDKAATEKKILTDAFAKGDKWFRTGDLLRMGDHGYIYFVDRIGDTFRWKGENVATSEVAEALSVYDGLSEANVYGVHVPGADGRAGMAAIVTEGQLDLTKLAGHVKAQLPAYARPMFLRLLPEMEITGTFKHRKVDLQKEGFDPATISDPLYFYDDVAGVYVPLDADLYDKICAGSLRF